MLPYGGTVVTTAMTTPNETRRGHAILSPLSFATAYIYSTFLLAFLITRLNEEYTIVVLHAPTRLSQVDEVMQNQSNKWKGGGEYSRSM